MLTLLRFKARAEWDRLCLYGKLRWRGCSHAYSWRVASTALRPEWFA